MDTRDTTVDAIVLKVRDYKEQDKLLTFFGLQTGKATAIARGAAKPDGSLRAVAQPFCRAKLTLTPPKGGISYISAGQAEGSFISLGADLASIAYAAYISELADIAMPDNRRSENFFALLLAIFSLLKMHDQHATTARFFEVRLLAELGLLPELDKCDNCGRSIYGSSFHLSADKGALLCASCGQLDSSPLISAGSVLTLRRLAEVPFSKMPSIKISGELMEELEAALGFFLDYHLDYSTKAKKVLHQLLD